MKRRGWNKKQTIVAVIIVLIVFATGIILSHYIKEFYKKDVDSKGSLYQLRLTGFPYLLPPDYKECTDSDGGRDVYTKGTTVGLAADMVMSTDTDFCRPGSPGYLVEWYCTSDDYVISFRTNTNYECLDGICEDGACAEGSRPPSLLSVHSYL